MLVQLSFTRKQLDFVLVRAEPMLGSCDLADKQLKSVAMQVASLSMRSESRLVQLVQKQKQFAQKPVQVELKRVQLASGSMQLVFGAILHLCAHTWRRERPKKLSTR